MDTLNYMVAIASRAGAYNKNPGPPNPDDTYNLDGKRSPCRRRGRADYKIPRISLNLNVF